MKTRYTTEYKEHVTKIVGLIADLCKYDRVYPVNYFYRLITINVNNDNNRVTQTFSILETLTSVNIIIKDESKNVYTVNPICKNPIPIELIECAENNNMDIGILMRNKKIEKIREKLKNKPLKKKSIFRFRFPWNKNKNI